MDTSSPSAGIVEIDKFHQRCVHIQPGRFTLGRAPSSDSSPQVVDFTKPELRSVRLTPDEKYFAFLCGSSTLGCVRLDQPNAEALSIVSRWGPRAEVLDFFWYTTAGPLLAETYDLAVLSTQSLEAFRVTLGSQPSAKSLKAPAYQAAIRLCWTDPVAAAVLVCIGQRTLQPYDLKASTARTTSWAKSPKLPKFDLVLPGGLEIQPHDIGLLTLYGTTFCIHADGHTGRVSLRNVSNPLQGHPEHDIVLDVYSDEAPVGPMQLSCVNNLLLVHRVEKAITTIFDIGHFDGTTVPSLCGPGPIVATTGGTVEELSWEGWEFCGNALVLNRSKGTVHKISVDMVVVIREFTVKSAQELASVVKVLLRRTGCRDQLVGVLRKALSTRTNSSEWAQCFTVLNLAYRGVITAVPAKTALSPSMGRQATVSLQDVENAIGDQSILSEKEMVEKVFQPHFEELSSSSGSTAGKPPQLLSILVSYLRSLLGMQLLPHSTLQCFIFDVCVKFDQQHVLQQLVHYHVLLDLPDLVQKLKELALGTSSKWAIQACLDMSLRLGEFQVVAEILLGTRQYLEVIPFLTNQREAGFPLRNLLEQVEQDQEAQKEDPDLWNHLLDELRQWKLDADASARAAAMANANAGASPDHAMPMPLVVPPNLEGCAKWLPELEAA